MVLTWIQFLGLSIELLYNETLSQIMIGIEKLFKIDHITIAKPRASIKGFAFFHMFLNPFLGVCVKVNNF